MPEALRHPIKRAKSKLAHHDDKHDRRHTSDIEPQAVRHPLKQAKTKARDHDCKQHHDSNPEALPLLDSQPSSPPRRPNAYNTKMARPRWILHVQAQVWRFLMGLGMLFHKMAPPRPPKPDFVKTIPVTIGDKPGQFKLMFYVPKGYTMQKKLWKGEHDPSASEEDLLAKGKGKQKHAGPIKQAIQRRNSSAKRWGRYPVVINYHGGGFTLGKPTDDARWCGTVVDECNAVVVSVEYRLAPECPFPTAVEDGVDAVIWVHQHAEELGIDVNKIALSGFSSGANMAFSVPLRLWDEMMGFPREDESIRPDSSRPDSSRPDSSRPDSSRPGTSRPSNPFMQPYPDMHKNPFMQGGSAASSRTRVGEDESSFELMDPVKPLPSLLSIRPTKTGTEVSENALLQISDISIRAIVPWYPSVDYTRTREQRRATNPRKDQQLPALFTDLFDESYLHPPAAIALDSPYLSPGVAPTALLRDALPQEIIMYTCEWDMLLDEGQAFRDRLQSPEIGKSVYYKMVPEVPHGWDKAPNPWKPTPGVKEHYLDACKELRRIFGDRGGERRTSEGWASKAPRGSISVVR